MRSANRVGDKRLILAYLGRATDDVFGQLSEIEAGFNLQFLFGRQRLNNRSVFLWGSELDAPMIRPKHEPTAEKKKTTTENCTSCEENFFLSLIRTVGALRRNKIIVMYETASLAYSPAEMQNCCIFHINEYKTFSSDQG